MIKSFYISNFKGLKHFELSHLSQITLLAGRNNVGKSTVLEGIFTFFDRLDPNILINSYGWRGVASTSVTPDGMWAPSFRNYDLETPIRLGGVINNEEQAVEIRFDPKFVPQIIPSFPQSNGSTEAASIKTDQPSQTSTTLTVTHFVKGQKRQAFNITVGPSGLQFTGENIDSSNFRVAILNLRSHENSNDLSARYGELDVKGEQDAIADFLRIMDTRLKSLSVVALNNAPVIHADIGIGRKIPIAYMGDGVARLLSIRPLA